MTTSVTQLVLTDKDYSPQTILRSVSGSIVILKILIIT